MTGETHTVPADFKRTDGLFLRQSWFSAADANSDLTAEVCHITGSGSVLVAVTGHEHLADGKYILDMTDLVQRFLNVPAALAPVTRPAETEPGGR